MDKQIAWVKCPACSEEWTKLSPCKYLNDNKKESVPYLCVICAETLVSWDWLVFRFPMEGIRSYTVYKKPLISRIDLGGKVVELYEPSHAFVRFEIGDREMVATSAGTSTPITFKFKDSEEHRKADNIFALRSKILNTVPF